jgi:hypothetical protein
MNGKKNRCTIVILFIFSIVFNTYAQESRLKDQVKITNNQVKKDKDKVIIDFDVWLNEFQIPSDDQLTLTPVFKTDEGKTLALPVIIINGKKRDNLYIRSLVLDPQNIIPAYYILRAPQKTITKKINYKTEIPFEKWMTDASLFLDEDLCGCGGNGMAFSRDLVANRISLPFTRQFEYDYKPSVRFTDPPREDPKKRDERGEAYLIFKTGKWDILPELFDNRKELRKIEQSLHFVNEEPTAVITSVSIKAYASPEGAFDMNYNLSVKRAGALRAYVQTIHKIPSGILSSDGFGEDWDGLVKLIEDDHRIENKADVLRIIKTVSIFEGREKQLMELAGGRSYAYMLKNLFPLLRRSVYTIEYTVPEFSLERGKELSKTKPKMLSLKEIYEVANTYEKGSEDFIELFNAALKNFPEDKFANLNAAAAYILENDYESAGAILEKYKNEPEAWNNLGVVFSYQCRFEEAEEYLQKAHRQGDAEARHNLAVLGDLKNAFEAYQKLKKESTHE